MGQFSADAFVATLALIGVVIIVSALLSGLIERTGLPQVAVFLALGAILGPAGLGVLHITLGSPMLRVIATLSLALVLFTDAVGLDLVEVRRYRSLALLMLGPGTLLSAALIALAAWKLLGLSGAESAILGAALASTDPVLLRGLLRDRGLPGAVRQALKLESGFNDAVLLPIVLVAMAFLGHDTVRDTAGWARLGLDLFLLGPGAGVLVGVVAVSVLDVVRRRLGVRRDYESLYSLGVALTAYAVAESVHGSGFLACFAAGLTVSALDVELCDCFLEYGETTAEMALLLTFVLFGSSLIWDGFLALSAATALFAALVLLVRLPVFGLALAGVRLDRGSRALIAWFGPRGLSSLLEVLLPVFAGLSGSQRLFEICCLVVLLSVVIHGGTPMLLTQRARRSPHQGGAAVADQPSPGASGMGAAALLPATPEPARATVAVASAGNEAVSSTLDQSIPAASDGLGQPARDAGAQPAPAGEQPAPPVAEIAARETTALPAPGAPIQINRRLPIISRAGSYPAPGEAKLVGDVDRITIDELRHLWDLGQPVTIIDARTERSHGRSDLQARGAIRLLPDHVREQAVEVRLSHEAWLVVYCA